VTSSIPSRAARAAIRASSSAPFAPEGGCPRSRSRDSASDARSKSPCVGHSNRPERSYGAQSRAMTWRSRLERHPALNSEATTVARASRRGLAAAGDSVSAQTEAASRCSPASRSAIWFAFLCMSKWASPTSRDRFPMRLQRPGLRDRRQQVLAVSGEAPEHEPRVRFVPLEQAEQEVLGHDLVELLRWRRGLPRPPARGLRWG
jgi:hypothetical protein